MIYIGKNNHPEAVAMTMNDHMYFYDINKKFDYEQVATDKPLVINQTTLSFLELKTIHEEIKSIFLMLKLWMKYVTPLY